jgi:Reverse transcriptase (RNA-dependent DNA polymerase)
MDKIPLSSLDWANTHIERYGDTDILPVPFEFDAIRHSWTKLRTYLGNLDLNGYPTRASRQFLFPKGSRSFRVARQLDPIDALIYTAMVHESSPLIEAFRVPKENDIACSYRIMVDPKGRFFSDDSGWAVFNSRSKTLAEDPQYNYVLLADVADFYNQIAVHRIPNGLEDAGVSTERAKNFENFLLRLNASQSQGIPVGPLPSAIVAELCMNDVDTLLLKRGAPHVRFVDDFRIFCRTPGEAIQVLHDLTEYLHTAHRLALEGSKTRILTTERFVDSELHDPERAEEAKRRKRINALVNQILAMTGYVVTAEDLPPEDSLRASRRALGDLLNECLATKPFRSSLARYVLRRAHNQKTAVLREAVLGEMETLVPVFRDAMRYLIRATPKVKAAETGEALMSWLEKSAYGGLPLVRYWILEVADQRADIIPKDFALKSAAAWRSQLGIRPLAMLARRHRDLAWIKGQKEDWKNHSPWDRRAVIWSANALSSTERSHWLSAVENQAEDPLDRVVAAAAR